MMVRILIGWSVGLLIAGCGESFKPPSHVDGLRILAMRAEPPEIARGHGDLPAESLIASLVADPAQLDDPDRTILVAYLSCTPDPTNPAPSICTAFAGLQDPGQLADRIPRGSCGEGGGGGEGAGGGGSQSPIAFIGAERCDHVSGCEEIALDVDGIAIPLPRPRYRIPDHLDLDSLPAENPSRTKGVQAVILALAAAASPEELREGLDTTDPCTFSSSLLSRFLELYSSRDHVVALKRVQVRGPDQKDEPNVNPAIAGLLSSGTPLPARPEEPWPPSATFAKGSRASLHPRPPAMGVGEDGLQLPLESLYQSYTRYRADGSEARNEEEHWTHSWFATAGALDTDRSHAMGELVTWDVPAGTSKDPVPGSGRAFLYVVVRDGRGGADWAVREVRITR